MSKNCLICGTELTHKQKRFCSRNWLKIAFRLAVVGGILAILFELSYIEYTLHMGFGWTKLEFLDWLWLNTIARFV